MGKDGSALKKDLDQKQIILVVGLFVVLAAVLYFFVLSGGGDEPPADLGAPPATDQAPLTESPEEDPVAEEPDEGTVETFELFTRRDPFEPVIDTSAGGDGSFGTPDGSPDTGGAFDPGTDTGTTPDPGTDPGTTGGTTSPTDPGSTNGSTSGSGNGSASNGSTNSGNKGSSVGGHRVKLIDVFRKNNSSRAQVQVDGTVYTVDPGETFATSFQLVSASGECASMLFGDDQFTMCEGEEILK